MAEYRRGAHTVFEIHLHLVWITKYRRPALTGEIATRVRDLIRDICGQHEVSIPWDLAVSRAVDASFSMSSNGTAWDPAPGAER